MLEHAFVDIYTKFKLKFYRAVFHRFEAREANLSAVETFCVELIYALQRPTVREFADFAQISPPNAAYKINSLLKKGYIRKVQNEHDKREFHLEVTEKFLEYNGITYDYISIVMDRIRKRFSAQEVDQLEKMLDIISAELMPEVAIKSSALPPV